METASDIGKRIWDYCHELRHAGTSYGDYLEQLTYLLFLKMVNEREEQLGKANTLGKEWPILRGKSGEELRQHYDNLLGRLGSETGLVGTIFSGAVNKVRNPASLYRLIKLIDEVNWSSMDVDVKGAIYEDLLQRNAQEVKSGAGQYFTPRPLIEAIVAVMQPRPGDTICDPACGTGGFLLSAYDYVKESARYKLDRDQLRHLRSDALSGWELVPETARLCVMNLYLHGVGLDSDQSVIQVKDSLLVDPGSRYSMILTNPPFGKRGGKSGDDEADDSRAYNREDFWTTTGNKQLNFIQHIKTLLDEDGRAAVVVPDNVLFEGGAGETIRRKLLEQYDLHTLLRLPTGIFYSQGVKANVLFFDRRPAARTKEVWIYDLRTNQNFTLKQRTLKAESLDDFVACYHAANRHQRTATWSESNPEGRWRCYTYDEIAARDKASLDITWLRDLSLEDSAMLPEPDVLATEIMEDLEAALEQFREVAGSLTS